MRFIDLIEKKKLGIALSKDEIAYWISAYVAKEIPEYQVSALLMAIYFQGMNELETAQLCEAMLHSGDRYDLSRIQGCKADKHSTGGVGDKTSLALAPMVAACGLKVAKMSGRGLGHTGGTLDKVEAIDGFQVELDEEAFIKQVNEIGLALIGQSSTLVPADKLLYALRDVSGTVNSIPLIATSIMSKKLAAGADTILLDVKFGEGAFMATPEEAEVLAKTMIDIGHHFGKDTKAMLSDMNQPLGNAIGNALEVKEAIATLKGEGPKDFEELCLKAGSIMLMQGGLANDESEARTQLQLVLHNGEALKKLEEMVRYQGGNMEQIRNPDLLPKANDVMELSIEKEGYIKQVHALKLGNLAMRLGAGRAVKEDVIDPAVGIVLRKKAGDFVNANDTLADVHCNQFMMSREWLNDFYDCFEFTNEKVEKAPLVYKIVE